MNRTERCPRDGKRLTWTGEILKCAHCGYRAIPDPGTALGPDQIREAIRKLRDRAPLSPKCYGRLHHLCQMPGCGCPHHDADDAITAEGLALLAQETPGHLEPSEVAGGGS